MASSALTGLAGVPETLLSRSLVSRLPESAAAAPWTCLGDVVLWVGRGGRSATSALAPALRRGTTGLAVLGAMVRYRETPVGGYDEVLGMVLSRTRLTPWGSVTFMSVDSAASLVAGRTNWAIPKTLSSFTGEVAGGSTFSASGADETRWTVTAKSRVLGPSIRLTARGRLRQQFPDGRVGSIRLKATGVARPALITVEVDSEGPLPSWLRPGRHLGAVAEALRFSLDEPGFG